MTFDDILAQVCELLQREGRVSYRALKVRFQLEDDLREAVKDELIYAKSWLLMRSIACWCGLVTKPSPYRLEPLECQYSPLLRPQTKNVPPCPIHLNT